MEFHKLTCFILLLIVCLGSLFVDAQPPWGPGGYGRRRMMGRRRGRHFRRDFPDPGGIYPGSGEVFTSGMSTSWSQSSALHPPRYTDPSLDGSVLHPPGYVDGGVPVVPRVPVYPGAPMMPVYPGVPSVPIAPVVPDGRPNVVDDRSGRTNLNLNIHNENNNKHNQAGANRVTVTQGGNTNTCDSPCGPHGECPYPTMCMPNANCPGNFGCE